jgi:hypothetical protein
MYLRRTKRTRRDGTTVEYYQLAQNIWNPQNQRSEVQVVYNFGRADELDKSELERLARSIMRVCNDGVDVPKEVGADPLSRIEIEWTKPLGAIHVLRGLWEELGIGNVLRHLQSRRADAAPHETAIFAMVANRLLLPLSKLACCEHWLPEEIYCPEAESLEVEQLYFAMDFLEDHVAEIERRVFEQTADLFNVDVDLIFWDTTTVFFEVDEEDEVPYPHHGRIYEPLRKRGHNKDGPDGAPQVVIGLAVTRDGMPVRSWVFPGNTVDVTTVKQIKADLKEWRLARSIIVGDAGMDSAENRIELAKGVGKYILAMPVGRLKEVQEEVLSHPGRYKRINDALEVKEVVIGDGERRRRYVVCRNVNEASRQREHREKVLEELQELLHDLARTERDHPKRACELIASGRYGRYLSQTENGRPYIDQKKVAKARRMDGRYVLLTNDDTLLPEDVGQGYKAMMIIESCFRRMKTTMLRTRPVYHWVPHRIISHVKLCVLALLLQRAAELRAKDTWRNIRHALQRIQVSRYRLDGKAIVQTTNIPDQAREYLISLGASKIKRIISISDAP